MKTGEMVFEAPAVPSAGVPTVRPVNESLLIFSRRHVESSRLMPVLILVLWLGCSLITALGLAMPYGRPHPAAAQPAPLKVEMLSVELTTDPLPDLEPPKADPLALPPPPDVVAQPNLPQATAVAMPSPAIAFALPVKGPVRVVEAAQASYARSEAPIQATTAGLPVQALTFGQGAGKQPAPEYPLAAQDARQEGVVKVRFVVAENGRVTVSEAVTPSPWSMLNESAVRTIRNRWRFTPGMMRAYEVAIRFVLPK